MALRIWFPSDVCSKNADALVKRGWTPRVTAAVYVSRDMASSVSNQFAGVDVAEVAPESSAEEVDDDNDDADDDDEEVVVEDAGTGER